MDAPDRLASWGEESIEGMARVFAAALQDPASLKALTDLGMKANTAQELIADSAQYGQLFAQQGGATQVHKAEGTYLEDTMRDAGKVVDALDALVQFVFENNKNELLSWNGARRIELQRAKRPAPTPTVEAA